MSQVIALAKSANISRNVVAWGLGVTRATTYNWEAHGVPDERIPQLEMLRDSISKGLDNGILPRRVEDYVWKGLIHLNECW